MKSIKTQAIVLRRTNYGEADRIVQLLTPNGKRCVMVKGVRREKSRLAGGIELFAICDVVIGEGKGEIGTLVSARLVTFFRHIIEDYDRMQFAYQVIKLVSKSSDMVDGHDWYELLAETLAGLNLRHTRLDLIKTWFYLRHSALMGYELSLWHDIDGDKLLADETYRYDVGERGLKRVCSGDINSDHIKFMRLMSTRPLNVVSQVGGLDEILGDCLSLAITHASI